MDHQDFITSLEKLVVEYNWIDPKYYEKFNVKRGLRNQDGSGVLVGLTGIGDVHGYVMDEGEYSPVEGRLRYRGIDVFDLVRGIQKEGRPGFEETIFLLLFGRLPNENELNDFNDLLNRSRQLPNGFKENMIMRFPSVDIMNKLQRSILVSYSYDNNPDDNSLNNELRQLIELIARFPLFVAYAYQAKSHYIDGASLYIHNSKPELGTASNFLRLLRPGKDFSPLEAELLDLALVLHAEHGGGNNSSFTVHVVSSTDTDTYSAISAAVGSLKGPKHGGANYKVLKMIQDIKENVSDWDSHQEIKEYLKKIISKEAFDKSGLIYGMGHAVYSYSDPRAVLLQEKARELAMEKGLEKEFNLYYNIENISKEVFRGEKGMEVICANVDFYSGFVYNMLNIPQELHTPIFAIARVAGWAAHRIEEVLTCKKIIRPAYKYVSNDQHQYYIPLNERR